MIFAPILQLGCFNACTLVTTASSSIVLVRKGPPEAVSNIFSTGFSHSPDKHWKMAECSESTGRIGTLCSTAKAVISSPATTSVSLFANAIALPALIAAIVGFSPAYPTIAVSTISIGSDWTTWAMASEPAHTLIGRSSNASFNSGYFCSLAITTTSGIYLRA